MTEVQRDAASWLARVAVISQDDPCGNEVGLEVGFKAALNIIESLTDLTGDSLNAGAMVEVVREAVTAYWPDKTNG